MKLLKMDSLFGNGIYIYIRSKGGKPDKNGSTYLLDRERQTKKVKPIKKVKEAIPVNVSKPVVEPKPVGPPAPKKKVKKRRQYRRGFVTLAPLSKPLPKNMTKLGELRPPSQIDS